MIHIITNIFIVALISCIICLIAGIIINIIEKKKPKGEFHKEVEAEVTEYVRSELNAQLNKFRDIVDLQHEVEILNDKLSNLRIEKSKIEEQQARREREIEHKLGLERARQNQELVLAKREAILEVKETNLKKQQEQFVEDMKFMQNRFTEEVKYQRGISEKMLEYLPKMTINQEIK